MIVMVAAEFKKVGRLADCFLSAPFLQTAGWLEMKSVRGAVATGFAPGNDQMTESGFA
jgi:hypothetical protein